MQPQGAAGRRLVLPRCSPARARTHVCRQDGRPRSGALNAAPEAGDQKCQVAVDAQGQYPARHQQGEPAATARTTGSALEGYASRPAASPSSSRRDGQPPTAPRRALRAGLYQVGWRARRDRIGGLSCSRRSSAEIIYLASAAMPTRFMEAAIMAGSGRRDEQPRKKHAHHSAPSRTSATCRTAARGSAGRGAVRSRPVVEAADLGSGRTRTTAQSDAQS